MALAYVTDLAFYAVAVPAVILTGFSKAGLGGAVGSLSVPLMSLAIAPPQAVAIMLPILLLMDAMGLVAFRGRFDARVLRIAVPSGLIGIVLGWVLFRQFDDRWIRALIGAEAVIFGLQKLLEGRAAWSGPPAALRPGRAVFWSAISGFTSFVSHAGGPPFQMYVLPLKLDKTLYAGTGVIFFAVVNAVKLPPYFALGQFSAANLMTSAMLIPLAPLATFAGAWLVKRVDQTLFYRITYAALIPVGLKLIWDGIAG